MKPGDYNCLGIRHTCTYLGHRSGEEYRKVEAQRDVYREALERIIALVRDVQTPGNKIAIGVDAVARSALIEADQAVKYGKEDTRNQGRGSSLDWLTPVPDASGSIEEVFALDEATLKYVVLSLAPGGWLILNWDKEHFWLKFACVEFVSSDLDGSGTQVRCVFHGTGPTEGLREFRHTWWGDGNGYLFYAPREIITAALKALDEFYD